MPCRARIISAFIMWCCITLTACVADSSSKMTVEQTRDYWQQRIDQIKVGMTPDQVDAILGDRQDAGGSAGPLLDESAWLINDLYDLSPHDSVAITYLVPTDTEITDPNQLDMSRATVWQKPQLVHTPPVTQKYDGPPRDLFDEAEESE